MNNKVKKKVLICCFRCNLPQLLPPKWVRVLPFEQPFKRAPRTGALCKSALTRAFRPTFSFCMALRASLTEFTTFTMLIWLSESSCRTHKVGEKVGLLTFLKKWNNKFPWKVLEKVRGFLLWSHVCGPTELWFTGILAQVLTVPRKQSCYYLLRKFYRNCSSLEMWIFGIWSMQFYYKSIHRVFFFRYGMP